MRTLGLCLIIKNEKDNLERLVLSIKGEVDSVFMTDTGSTDGSIQQMEKLCMAHGLKLVVSHFDWVNNFSKARNFNFQQADTDWILWLDGDDTLEKLKGFNLREEITQAEYQGATGIVMEYKYNTDKKGNDLNSHPKLRCVKNGFYSWTHKTAGEVPIHENLFPINGEETKDLYSKNIYVSHHVTDEMMEDSKNRNIKILKELLEKEGNKPDPRTVFLLGRELSTTDDKDGSSKYLKQFVEMGGTEGELLHACSMLSKYYESKGMFNKQLEWAVKGISYHPLHPLGYINAAEAYRNKGMWEEVIEMCKQSFTKNVSHLENLSFSEFALNKLATVELVNAYNEIKEHDKAEELINKLLPKLQENESESAIQARNKVIIDSNKTRLEKSINTLANSIIAEGNMRSLSRLLDIIPDWGQSSKPVLEIKRSLGINKLWNKGNIVIYATTGLEEWHEESLEKGIGGSETAVIEMAKRWGKMGYHVTIYGDVNEERVFENVKYVPAPLINWADKFDIFISWRNINLFKEIDVWANYKYLWLHDVPISNDFIESTLSKIDKVIVLSNYHRRLLPDVPDEKIYVSRNGIDSDLMKSINVEKNPKQVIYASQPIRGLEELLNIWSDVKKEVPEAELVWAYGWDNYDIMIEKGIASQEFKYTMVAKMKELDVKDLGRLGKKELYKAFKQSSIFAYPSTFPEISCIVAMEAQAAGCYPITTGYAALKETQITGDKIDLNSFKDTLVKRLKEGATSKVNPEMFGWNKVSKEWANDLFYGVEWEDQTPLVSLVYITARKGGFKKLVDEINKQSYSNIEVIIVDKMYEERVAELDALSKLKVPHLHIPDPQRDRTIYKYGLCHAHNAALSASTGELLVFLQDNYKLPEDGIEKFVNLYLHYPKAFLAGVDKQYEDWLFKKLEWKSMWITIGKGRRMSVFAREWEANWGAAPRTILEKLGGWNIEWDKGFGWDNVEIAFRYIEMGGKIIVDENNLIKGVRHKNDWQTNMTDSNGQRFMSYAQATQKSKKPKLTMEFKEPKYSNLIKKLIYNFKNRQ